MASTQNYDIPLPQLGEPADIRVLDQGTEMIDGIMHGTRTMIAPAWVSTETYNTGSRVVYLGEYYKCKADNVTGAWDATKWDKTTVGEDIEGLGTGGASELADLDDVEITSPTDGQALLYDDSDDKWKNGTLPDPSVVKEVTGNPIEITDAASAPLVKCVSQITGYQSGSGTPSPDNIRPITAYTEGEIEVVGRNLFNPAFFHSSSANVTYSVGSDGTITVTNSDSSARTYNWLFTGLLFNGKYTLSTSQNLYVQFSASDYSHYVRANESYTFDYDGSSYLRILAPNISANTSITYKVMLNSGQSAMAFEPFTQSSHTTTYPSAIYRGSEDVVNGSVVSNAIKRTFDGTTSIGAYSSGASRIPIIYISNAINRDVNALSNLLDNKQTFSNVISTPNSFCIVTGSGYAGILIHFDGYIGTEWTTEQIQTILSTNALEVVYTLATPTTSSVTPTNLPIKSLSGYNHIESSTGNLELEYISGNYQALVDLIQSSSHVYSTAEQVVGKWIDGKDIYEITVANELALSSSWQQYFDVSGIDTIVDVVMRTTRDSEEVPPAFSQYEIATWIKRSGYIQVSCNAADWKILSMTIRYTKSTSTRSLSAPVTSQKAQIEPLTDKTEEVPTEEEKAVETPVEEPETEEKSDER